MGIKKTVPIFFVIMAFTFFLVPSSGFADWGQFWSKFHPYLSVQEEYTDNYYLTPSNRQDDWITTVGGGIRFSTLPPRPALPAQAPPPPEERSGIDLDYFLGLTFNAKHSEDNYVENLGNLHAWYTFDRGVTFRVRDYLISSADPRETAYTPAAIVGQYLLGTQRDREPYTRNVFSPSLEYQFGREDRFEILYTNNYYNAHSDASEDSQENKLNPRIIYWFDIRNGITLDYIGTRGDFERSPEFFANEARGRYTHRFNPRTSIFIDYWYQDYNFDSPGVDYYVHNPSIGIDHAFNPTLRGTIQIGYYWQKSEDDSTSDDITYNLSLIQSLERTSFTLSFQGGFTQDYFTAENRGFTKYHRLMGAISHIPYQRMTMGLHGSVERAESNPNREDWIWEIGGNISYSFFPWMNMSLGFIHRENNSNTDNLDYMENLATLRIVLSL